MINHHLMRTEGVLILTPRAPLAASDFADLARVQFWCEAEQLIMAGHEPG